MNSKHNKNLTPNSQNLRKNMTPEEKRLWYNFLRDLPITVNRQKIIGKYIVDFYCAERKTVIEIDGTHHQEDYFKNQDEIREEYLKEKGSKLRAILAAKEMLKENEPIEKIVKYTMLSKEEILDIEIEHKYNLPKNI